MATVFHKVHFIFSVLTYICIVLLWYRSVSQPVTNQPDNQTELPFHFKSIIHTCIDAQLKKCGSDSEICNQASDEQPLRRIQLDWPVAWVRVVSGRRWRRFPSATTPGRAGHQSPWRCRWRRWSWPACHRTAPACDARPGGCHSLTWTWKCSAVMEKEDVKGCVRKTLNLRDKWRKKCECVSVCSTQNRVGLIAAWATCKQHSISLMNTALTQKLIQLAQNKRWKWPADVWERGTRSSKFISSLCSLLTHLCYSISAYYVTFVLHLTPTITFSISLHLVEI